MPRCRNIFALFPPFPPAKTNASFAGAVPQCSWHARALSYVIFVSLPGAPIWPTGLIQPLEPADLVSAREAAVTFYICGEDCDEASADFRKSREETEARWASLGARFLEPCAAVKVQSPEVEVPMARKTKKRRYSRSSGRQVESEMRRYKKGTARSGRKGGRVKSRKQAIAIGLSKARKKGEKVPKKKS